MQCKRAPPFGVGFGYCYQNPYRKERPQTNSPNYIGMDVHRETAGLLYRMNPNGYHALLVSHIFKKKNWSGELVRRDFLPGTQQDYTETQIVPWTTVAETLPTGTELSAEHIGITERDSARQVQRQRQRRGRPPSELKSRENLRSLRRGFPNR